MATNQAPTQFTGPIAQAPGLMSLVYTRPDLMEAVSGMNQPQDPTAMATMGMNPQGSASMFTTPSLNFTDSFMKRQSEMAATNIKGHSMEVLKGAVMEHFLSGIQLFQGGKEPLARTFGGNLRVGATQMGADVYNFLAKGVDGSEALKFKPTKEQIKRGVKYSAFEKGSLRRTDQVFRQKGTLGHALPFLIPKGTGLRSALFWNITSGNFEENLTSSYTSFLWNIGKYAAAAQVVNAGSRWAANALGGSIASRLETRGGMVRAGKGDLTGAMFMEAQRDAGVGEHHMDRTGRLGAAGRETWGQRFKSFLGMESDERAAKKSSRAMSLRMGNLGLRAFGMGLRAINFAGMVHGAVSIVGEAMKYRDSVRANFQREALSYETSFEYNPELPGASSERQRAIEAIQSSSLNLRNMIGQEGQLMHNL